MRINSINFEKYTTFALAAMVVNRVVSLVDVIILNKRQRSNFSSIVRPKGYDGLELELCIKF